MATPKESKKKSSPKKPAKNTVEHYNAILIEELRSEFKFVIEKVSDSETRLTQMMNERFAEHDDNFRDISKVLKHHSQLLEQNEKRWEQNEKRWEQNEKRWENNEKRWENNDERLERIETKLDHVIERVDEHDEQIEAIQLKMGIA